MSVAPRSGATAPVAGAPVSAVAPTRARARQTDRPARSSRYLRRNKSLPSALLLAWPVLGRSAASLVDTEEARPLSVPALQPPSWELPFGSDRQGRDLLAVMIAGTPLTLRIGLIAGFIGVGIGTVSAFVRPTTAAGRHDHPRRRRRRPDHPGPAGADHPRGDDPRGLSVNQMALVVASLAWLYPTRTIRAQVLTHARARLRPGGAALRHERAGDHRQEMLPNLLPYLAAALVNAVSAAVLASIGLEVLGLGPIESPTLGMTLYWVNFNAAADQRLVVVVGAADRGHPASCSSACSWSRSGWTRSRTRGSGGRREAPRRYLRVRAASRCRVPHTRAGRCAPSTASRSACRPASASASSASPAPASRRSRWRCCA